MLLNKRHVLFTLIIVLSMFMVGCDCTSLNDCRPEPKEEATVVKLIEPAEGSVITDTTGQIRVITNSGVNRDNLLLYLNGVNISNYPPLTISSVTGEIKGPFSNPLINSALALGKNTLIAQKVQTDSSGNIVTDSSGRPIVLKSQTMSFQFDNVDPRLEITSVVMGDPTDASAPVNVDAEGRPGPGSTITISGNIIDPSDITNAVGGFTVTPPSGIPIPVTITNIEPLPKNTFRNATKKFTVTLPGYPDVTVPTSTAHFSYTLRDIYGQTRTASFVAPATPISKSVVTQLNETLFDVVNPLVNVAINDLVSNVKLVLGQMNLYKAPIPGPCLSGLFKPNVTSCFYSIEDLQIVNPSFDLKMNANGGFKTYLDLWFERWSVTFRIAGFDSSNVHLGDLQTTFLLTSFEISTVLDVKVDPLNFVLDIKRETGFDTSLSQLLQQPAMVNSFCNICAIDLGPADLAYNIGILTIKGLIDLNNSLNPGSPIAPLQPINVSSFPAPLNDARISTFLIDEQYKSIGKVAMDAIALGLDLTIGTAIDGLLAVPPAAQKIHVLPGLTAPVSDWDLAADALSGFNLLGTTIPARAGKFFEITNAGVGTTFGVGIGAQAVVDGNVAQFDSTGVLIAVMNQGVYKTNMAVSTATPLGAWPVFNTAYNAHLDYVSTYLTKPVNFDLLANGSAHISDGLGSLFTPQNGYAIDYFPSKLPGGQGKPIDFVYNISANTINQYLFATYQSGWFEDDDIEVKALDLSTMGIGISSASTDVLLDFDFLSAPYVEFTPFIEAGSNIGGSISGVPVGTGNVDVPGTVKLVLNNINLKVQDETTSTTLFDVNADIEIRVSVALESGLPAIKPFGDFVNVRVNSATLGGFSLGKTAQFNAAKLDLLLSTIIQKQLDVFNLASGTVVDASNDIFKNAGICLEYQDNLDGTYKFSAQVSDSIQCPTNLGLGRYLYGYAVLIASALPREFGLEFRWFEIEPTGAYFTLAFDLIDKKLSGSACPLQTDPNAPANSYPPTSTTYFRAYCLK